MKIDFEVDGLGSFEYMLLTDDSQAFLGAIWWCWSFHGVYIYVYLFFSGLSDYQW